MNTRWTKIRADLLANKLRSGLAIAAMAVGTAAVGATALAATTVADSFTASYLDANPPSAVLRDRPVRGGGRRRGGRPPGRRRGRGPPAPARPGHDRYRSDGRRRARRHGRLRRQPDRTHRPGRGGLASAPRHRRLERASRAELGAAIGDRITIERPGDEPVALTVTGTALDVYEVAPMLGGPIRGYVAMDTMVELTGSSHLDTLVVRASEQPLDQAHARAVAATVRDEVLAPAGVAVTASITEDPGTHRAENSISFVVLAMQLLSLFALVIAVTLVVNTVTALLVQQRQQLGVMKAIGASVRQLTVQYLAYVVTLALAAVALAVPASMLLGRGIASFVAGLANIELVPAGVPLLVVATQVVLGTALPVVAVLIAVRRACRTTVREAITDRGLTADVRPSRWTFPVPRALLLATRNALRNRTRFALTVLTVAVCGGVLVGVGSTGAALRGLGDEVLGYSAFDLEISLSESVALDTATNALADEPGVETVEGWLRKETFLVRPDGTENDDLSLTAAPAGSASLTPTLLAGRWFEPGDDHAIVINTHLAEAEPDVTVGDRIALRTDGQLQEWHVVGVSSTTLVGPVAYVPVAQLAASVGDPDGVNTLAVRLADGTDQDQAADALRSRALDAGLPVALVTTNREVRAFVTGLFDIVVALLLLVGVVLAVVAVIGVAGTMTLGVVEQTRELGVLRTLGASSWTVKRVLLLQGVATALAGAALGVALSLPISALLRAAIGSTLISAELPFAFSWLALALWSVVAVAIGALGALQPARIAAGRSIRETLAYG
jgi:putative ABC transport system permease protein